MQELFDILRLPENSSKEEVKAAFISWKNEQQNILAHGKRDEQKIVAENITRVTALYKQFIKSLNQTDTTPEPITEINIPEPVIPTERIVIKQNNNPVVAVLVVVVVVLSGVIFYLLGDKNSISLPKINSMSDLVSSVKDSIKNLQEDKPITENQSPPETSEVKIIPERNVEVTPPAKEPERNSVRIELPHEGGQTLVNFHENITNKNFRMAYSCMSRGLQNRIDYDRWVSGFATTLSSEVSDIKVSSVGENIVTLTYVLKAVDNINGRREVSYFNGTVTIIYENGAWKIDKINNKVR